MVAGKLDPIVVQTCFHRMFQTVRNLKKMTTGMSSEGPKIGGGRYGWTWNGRKTEKSDDPRWRPLPRSPALSGRVRRRFAVKFHSQGRLVVALLPGWRVHQEGGRKRLPRLKTDWPGNGSKRPSSGPRVLGNFSRVLKLKMSVLGLGFYLACKTRFI